DARGGAVSVETRCIGGQLLRWLAAVEQRGGATTDADHGDRSHHAAREGSAAADATGVATYVVEGEQIGVDAGRVPFEVVGEAAVEVVADVHFSSRKVAGSMPRSAAWARSVAMPRLAWDFTVPGEM